MSGSRTPLLFASMLVAVAACVGFGGCGSNEGASSSPDTAAFAPETAPEEFAPGAESRPDEPLAPNATLDRADEAGPLPMNVPPDLGSSETPKRALPLRTRPADVAVELKTASPTASPFLVAPMGIASVREDEPAARSENDPHSAVVPRMAEISLEPPAAEAPPESAAMEMAPSPETTAARTPVAEDRGDYHAVTVFYGTDRNSNATTGRPARPHRMWLYSAGVCVLLFGLFALVAMASVKKKTFASLAVMSFSAACVLAVMGSIAWLQSGDAVGGPTREYGNGRGQFVMGTCEVSIPAGHQVAELEAPSVFRLDFVETPKKHVVLLGIEEQDSQSFFTRLRQRVDQSDSKDAFVFVHGFNVTFEDAARRTAQLSYDLKFQGAPIFYSWPSQGGLFQYAVDETNVVWTVPHLRDFLKEIADRSGARSVHLIAHSMGNRALTSALQELSLQLRGEPPLFHEVVLTAPDIDADIFRRDIAPAIVSTAKRVTLYASSNDEALVLSKQVHGYPRAGDTGDGLVVIPGIETIDVSAVDTSLLGHNYYGDNATVISDMIDLVRNSKSANERSWLEITRLNNLFYWVFRVDHAATNSAAAGVSSHY